MTGQVEARSTDAWLDILRDNAGAVRVSVYQDRTVVIGRFGDVDAYFPAEPAMSRRHFWARLDGGRLRVGRLPPAVNPMYYAGQARDCFLMRPGEQFVIGATRFVFRAGRLGAKLDASPPAPDLV